MPATGETCTTLSTFHVICPRQVKHAQHYLRSMWYAHDWWNMHNTIYVPCDMPVTGETYTTLSTFHVICPWQVKHAQHYLRSLCYARERWNMHNTIYVPCDMPVTGETCTTLPTFHVICPTCTTLSTFLVLCPRQVKHAQHYLRSMWYARDWWNMHNTIYVPCVMPATGETCTTLSTFLVICPRQVKHAQHYLRSIFLLPESEVKMTHCLSKFGNALHSATNALYHISTTLHTPKQHINAF
jgi:hypothetical protein